VRGLEAQGAVRAGFVVVARELGQDRAQGLLMDHDQVIEALAA
jgi:hypothetical protein